MKAQQAREQILLPYLKGNIAQLDQIINNISSGGWEAWLQIELSLQFIAKAEVEYFEREHSYYIGAGVLYDIRIQFKAGASIYFELKTQNSNLDFTTATRLHSDINKIRSLDADFRKKNVIIACTLSKLTNANEELQLKTLMLNPDFSGRLKAYDLDGNEIKQDKLKLNQWTVFWYTEL